MIILNVTLTPSFLSLRKALLRYSSETSSFSLNHCITKGSNQLLEKKNLVIKYIIYNKILKTMKKERQ